MVWLGTAVLLGAPKFSEPTFPPKRHGYGCYAITPTHNITMSSMCTQDLVAPATMDPGPVAQEQTCVHHMAGLLRALWDHLIDPVQLHPGVKRLLQNMVQPIEIEKSKECTDITIADVKLCWLQ